MAHRVLWGFVIMKNQNKKLSLATETLRVLTDELSLVHGGIVSSDNCPSAGMPCGPKRPQPEPGSCFCPPRGTIGGTIDTIGGPIGGPKGGGTQE